jgi:hypothetical protein
VSKLHSGRFSLNPRIHGIAVALARRWELPQFLLGGSRTTLDARYGQRQVAVSSRTGGTMKTSIKLALLMTFTVCGTIVIAAQESTPVTNQAKPAVGAVAADNMALYRQLAAETLTAFQAHDMSTAHKKARELEVTWDSREKALQKKSPDLWGQIDKAMDAFIKPVMQGKSPDPARVQTAYDTYIAKLQLAEPKR